MTRNLLLIMLLFLSVNSGFAKNKTIKGNGKRISTEIKIKDYENIVLDNFATDIKYEQDKSKEPYLRLEYDENLIEYVSIKTKNNTLVIKTTDDKVDITSKKNLKIFTNSSELSGIQCLTVLNLEINNPIFTKKFNLQNTGISNLKIDKINADEIYLVSTGMGDIRLNGSTNSLSINSTGKTKFKLFGLDANDVKIQSTGIDLIEVNADNSIDIYSSGISKIKYKGNPKIEKISKNDISSVKITK